MPSFSRVLCCNCIENSIRQSVPVGAAAVKGVYGAVQLLAVRPVIRIEHFIRSEDFSCIAISAEMDACLRKARHDVVVYWKCLKIFERDDCTVTHHAHRNHA